MQNEKNFKYEYFPDGVVIFEEGSFGTEVYFIVSGEAEVSQLVDDEKQVIAVLHKGDFFGEMAPLTDSLRSMTVKAVGDLYVYKLTLEEMLDYIMGNPEILKEICMSFARRLQDTDLKVRELSIRASLGIGEDFVRLENQIVYLRRKLKEKERQIENLREYINSLKK